MSVGRAPSVVNRIDPIVEQLKPILVEWLKAHPSGRYSSCKVFSERPLSRLATDYQWWVLPAASTP
jgi:hypothetical protein